MHLLTQCRILACFNKEIYETLILIVYHFYFCATVYSLDAFNEKRSLSWKQN
jgi:hypothetical protein